MIEAEKTEVPVSTTNLNVESQKKAKKTNVRVQEKVYGLLPVKELHKMCDEEYEMTLQDSFMEETKDKNNALEARHKETKGQRKEAEEMFVVEKEKLVGQIEALKGKLIALKEELIETKQHNASLQAEIGNNRQSDAISAAQAHQDVIEVLEKNAHLEGGKIVLEKELDELVTKARTLEGEVVRLQSNLVTSEAATSAAEEEANKLKSEAEEKFVVEKEKLVGQTEALKGKLIALKEEFIETKQHNASLQVEIGNNRQSAALSVAQAHQDVIEVLERNGHLEGEKIVLEKELEELVTKASRLEGEVMRLQSNLATSEAATEAAKKEANKLQLEAASLNKALEDSKRQRKEFVGEKEKLVGQTEALKQPNASLQVDIGKNHQSVAFSAAHTHQDMSELMERIGHLEAEILKKTGREEEGMVPNWVGNAVAASTGIVAAAVFISLYLGLRKHEF